MVRDKNKAVRLAVLATVNDFTGTPDRFTYSTPQAMQEVVRYKPAKRRRIVQRICDAYMELADVTDYPEEVTSEQVRKQMAYGSFGLGFLLTFLINSGVIDAVVRWLITKYLEKRLA